MKKLILSTLLIPIAQNSLSRSIHRPEHKYISSISTNWEGEQKKYCLKNWYLTYYPLFNLYDKEYFEQFTLPEEQVTFRNSTESVETEKLTTLINELLEDIKNHKTHFKNFKVLKKEDFNWNEPAGLLVFKFNDYPFVVKVFLETPNSFVKPFSKGWRPGFFFIMGGGITRYLSGFTRIPNLKNIKAKIEESEYWSAFVDTPRKWFYLPQNIRWFEVVGKNICNYGDPYIKFPSAYVIIADMIEGKPLKKIKKYRDQHLGLKLAQYLENDLDAHIGNFIIEDKTEKLVVIDSEHFRSVTGIAKNAQYSTYEKWYLTTTKKAFNDIFLQSKYNRRWIKKCAQCKGIAQEIYE